MGESILNSVNFMVPEKTGSKIDIQMNKENINMNTFYSKEKQI